MDRNETCNTKSPDKSVKSTEKNIQETCVRRHELSGCPSDIRIAQSRVLGFQTQSQLHIELHSDHPLEKLYPCGDSLSSPCSLSWWESQPTSSLGDRSGDDGSSSYLIIWLRNCMVPLGKWAKIPLLNKVIPTTHKPPGLDQCPCPEGVGLCALLGMGSVCRGGYLLNSGINSDCWASFLLSEIKSRTSSWHSTHANGRSLSIPCVFLETLPLPHLPFLFPLLVLVLWLHQYILSTAGWTSYNFSLLLQKKVRKKRKIQTCIVVF